ncbi:hypothetical protein BDW22DRAFT_1459835, partial [Trametopsis cervina]
SQNYFMRQWLENYRLAFEEAILAGEVAMSAGRECHCGGVADWRCDDCLGSPIQCLRCLHNAHALLPWHRVSRWQSSGYYTASSLPQTGMSLHCGHGGRLCPTRGAVQSEAGLQVHMPEDNEADLSSSAGHSGRTQRKAGQLTVIDVTGIHHITVFYCQCASATERYRQLLDLRLYPASCDRPATVFTFAVLDDFILHNRACNTPAQSYFNVLQRITDPIQPHLTSNRYREFLRVIRQWRHLKTRRITGVTHDGYRADVKGQMALFCPACPQPNINLPTHWENDPERWKYRVQLVMDGNFAAEHQRMKNPEDDVWLADGDGFFVGRSRFEQHIQTAVERVQRSSCNDHKAVNGPGHKSTLDATGIGATACARHGAMVPHSVVNFTRGEKQRDMDYSYVNSVERLVHPSISEAVMYYDVVCQWMVHLGFRIDNSPILSNMIKHLPNLRTVKGIGLFHVHGHKQACLPRFSPDFIKGVGMVDGEIIETLWASLNDTSRATRGMTSAHRQEAIDDQIGYSNWMKTIRIVNRIRAKYTHATDMLAACEEAFESVNNTLSAADRHAWSLMEATALGERWNNPEAMDIFDVDEKSAPGLADRLAVLSALETGRDSTLIGRAAWIANGLRLQEEQLTLSAEARRLTRYASNDDKVRFIRKERRLALRISSHETGGSMYTVTVTPGTNASSHNASDNVSDRTAYDGAEWDAADDEDASDDQPIATSTDLQQDQMPAYKLPVLLFSALPAAADGPNQQIQAGIKEELTLRQGQAEDRLASLRVLLAWKSVVFRRGVRPAGAYNERLRAWEKVRAVATSVRQQASIYEHTRRIMYAMTDEAGPEGVAIRNKFKPLTKDDMKISTEFLSSDIRGQRHTHQSWIWGDAHPSGIDNGKLLDEYRRVVWLRAKARRDRWKEETVLIPFELECIARFYQHYRNIWMDRAAKTHQRGQGAGYTAYALRQAHVWQRLEDHAIAARSTLQ